MGWIGGLISWWKCKLRSLVLKFSRRTTKVAHILVIYANSCSRDSSLPSLIYGQRMNFFSKGWNYVPKCSLRELMIVEQHNLGHFSKSKTLEFLKQDYLWPGMTKDVERHVQRCQVCQKGKGTTTNAGLYLPLPVTNKPWEYISMDFFLAFHLHNEKVIQSWWYWIVSPRWLTSSHARRLWMLPKWLFYSSKKSTKWCTPLYCLRQKMLNFMLILVNSLAQDRDWIEL